jgi:hypothetical protein
MIKYKKSSVVAFQSHIKSNNLDAESYVKIFFNGGMATIYIEGQEHDDLVKELSEIIDAGA